MSNFISDLEKRFPPPPQGKWPSHTQEEIAAFEKAGLSLSNLKIINPEGIFWNKEQFRLEKWIASKDGSGAPACWIALDALMDIKKASEKEDVGEFSAIVNSCRYPMDDLVMDTFRPYHKLVKYMRNGK